MVVLGSSSVGQRERQTGVFDSMSVGQREHQAAGASVSRSVGEKKRGAAQELGQHERGGSGSVGAARGWGQQEHGGSGSVGTA